MIVANLFNADLSSPSLVESNLFLEQVRLQTLLHGGFGSLTAILPIPGSSRWAHWYKWYNLYLNHRLVAWNEWGQLIFEGRVEDITPLPGKGIELNVMGYWSSCFDDYYENKKDYKSGVHTADEIIKNVLSKSCPQISNNYSFITDTGRNVSPQEIELLHPGDIIARMLEMGDEAGNPLYFAIWEDRTPYIVTRPAKPNWIAYMDDLQQPFVTPRSLSRFYSSVKVEYQVAGERGSVNDEGTASGENSNNRVTLTDTSKTWEDGQWDNNFEVVTVGGAGSVPQQVRDIKLTRKKPTGLTAIPVSSVVDAGTGGGDATNPTTVFSVTSSEKYTDRPGGSGHGFYWDDMWRDYYLEILNGACAGQSRKIVQNTGGVDMALITVSPGFDNPDNPALGVEGSGIKFRIYHPSRLFRMDGLDFTEDAYNNGYVVEIVQGFGTEPPQRFKITDTTPRTTAPDLPAYLTIEPNVDVSKTGRPFLSARPSEGNEKEALASPQIPSFAAAVYADTPYDSATEGKTYIYTDSYAEIIAEADVKKAGVATSATENTLTDSTASWTVDQWKGHSVLIYDGTNTGQKIPIKSNTATTLILSHTWEDDIPDSTSKYQIVVDTESEEAKEPEANQLLLSSPWETPIDSTTQYEIRQKEAGGNIKRSKTVSAGQAYAHWGVQRTLLLQLGTIQQGMAEAIIRTVLRLTRNISQESPNLVLRRIYHAGTGLRYPLSAVRAGGLIEIVDMPAVPSNLRQFFIIRTEYNEADGSLTITPERPDRELDTIIAAASIVRQQ